MKKLISSLFKIDFGYLKWRPASLSELTPMIFNTGLTHLGLDAFIYASEKTIIHVIKTQVKSVNKSANSTKKLLHGKFFDKNYFVSRKKTNRVVKGIFLGGSRKGF